MRENAGKFPHRFNSDGTVDSICPHCYITVATAICETELARIEATHMCDPARLEYYLEQRNELVKFPPGKARFLRSRSTKRVG